MGEQVGARICGGVAQLGEHLPCKQGVKSSNLSISTSVQILNRLYQHVPVHCSSKASLSHSRAGTL